MIDWSDLQYLLALSAHRSLPETAEALDVNRTTVSRRIGALENRLDVRLVERAGRELVLTPAGRGSDRWTPNSIDQSNQYLVLLRRMGVH